MPEVVEDTRELLLEISRPRTRVGCRLLEFYMRRVFPVMAKLGRRSQVTTEMTDYYWATIMACLAPESILAALRAAAFADVQRVVKGAVLSGYLARR